MATSEEHHRLVAMTARWFKRQGFAVIATELKSLGNREQPDVYACRTSCSAVAEIKVSRSDFLADQKKPERMVGGGGLGTYRFYVCPNGMINQNELPDRWGLLYVKGRSIIAAHAPKGNMWPSLGRNNENWKPFAHETDHEAERSALYSVARRLALGQSTYK